MLEFCEAALAVNPYRVGKPLFGPLAGCHGARRGTYRIVYRIDEANRTVHVLDIDHRAEIYHRIPVTARTTRTRPGDGASSSASRSARGWNPAGSCGTSPTTTGRA